MTDRLAKLRTIMQAQALEAVALVPGPNFRYVTGSEHFMMERPLVLFVPLAGVARVVIPSIEVELFKSHGFSAELYPWTDAEGYDKAFAAALADLNIKAMGAEALRMRLFELEILQSHGVSVKSADLSTLRIIKDADEIDLLRKAIHISEKALENTLAAVEVGMTERDIQSMLTTNMYAEGAETIPFALVLGGAKSALPHGEPGDYALQLGDPLLLDFGATYKGFGADITRTVFVGHPREQLFWDIYDAVRKANAAARDAAKPGMTAHELDAVSQAALREAGYGDLIIHRTGHGLGMEPHEWPNIVEGNQQVLEPGMVFTIEPGLYKVGSIGVRIEDNVVITETGCESLTTFSRELIELGIGGHHKG